MSRVIRVLLINAVNPYVAWETRYAPLGLGYLVSSVRKEISGAQIEFRIAHRDVYTVARCFKLDLVGISAVSQNFDIAKQYTTWFASQGVPVILGGIHVSVLPQSMPGQCTLACLGEGEMIFVEVIRAFLNNRLSGADLKGIRGIAFWEDGRLHVSPNAKIMKNIDNLPRPARDIMTVRRHAHMFTSRGCPFRCRFCATSRFWDSVRYFSPEYVVDEIEDLARTYKVNLIRFLDDLFTVKLDRLENILTLLEKRALLHKVSFTCNCRADMVTPELASLLARIGVVSVGMGLESGDDAILRFLKGGRASVIQNIAAIQLLRSAGIRVNASFVIGSPQETLEQVEKTYDFIRHSGLDLAEVYLLTPFPGTPIWDYAEKMGLVSDDMADWSCLNQNVYRNPDKAIVLSKTINRQDMMAVYKRIYRMVLRRNLVHVWLHPLRSGVFEMGRKLLVDSIVRRVPWSKWK